MQSTAHRFTSLVTVTHFPNSIARTASYKKNIYIYKKKKKRNLKPLLDCSQMDGETKETPDFKLKDKGSSQEE